MPACDVKPLPRDFYDRDPVAVARELLGMLLVRINSEGRSAGIIVETEAYLARNDPANHAYRGQTRRNASMFGPPGHAYIYTIHTRWCLNAVTEPAGVPSAVLIRAIEPVEGVKLMRERRDGAELREVARGPWRLCQALAIDRALDGHDLTLGRGLWIARPNSPTPTPASIVSTTRVGISSATDLPLRFYLADNPFVSRPARPDPSERQK